MSKTEDSAKGQLTKRQAQILAFVKLHSTKYGYPPTRVEIAERFKFKSATAAFQHLRALEAKGYVRIPFGARRAIQVLP